jgi:hypothetical protein
MQRNKKKVCHQKKSLRRVILVWSRVARWFVFKPKIPIWVNCLGVFQWKILAHFYDHLVYFKAIANILRPFGTFCGHLVYFSAFRYFVPRKIWQPWFGGKAVE